MNVYMTEEEQVEQLKKYWKKYGNHIMTVILVIVLLFSGNNWYKDRQAAALSKASNAFHDLMISASKNDLVSVEAKANYIKTTYPSSIYATSSSLVLAKQAVALKKYDSAITQLKWVIDKGISKSFKQVAELRLARIYLYQKKYETSLTVLSKIEEPLFLSIIHEIKGDVYLAQGQRNEASKQYNLSLLRLPNPELASKELMMKINRVSA